MRKTFGRDLTVGIVVLLAAFIFTIGIFSIGSEQRIWVRKVEYRIQVPDANGLQGGSPVRLAGVQVGTVTAVHFSSDPNNTKIEVDLAVDQAHQHRIREDTVANVKILTLLGGEKYVELTPGDPARPVLPPGSYLPVPETFGMEQLGELSASLADDITSISNNVRIILEKVQSQEGVVGRMLLDPNFGAQTFADVAESAAIARRAMEDIDRGRGLVGRALRDDELARDTFDSIHASLQRMETLLEKASREDSPVSQLVDPNGKVAGALEDLQQAAADVQDFTAQVKDGRGLMGRLINDEQYAEEVLANIRKVSQDLSAITSKLNQGDGTLGGLINDPELHEDLKNVVRGVKKSRVLSWFIRRSREKGEEAERKEEEERRKREPEGSGGPGSPQGAR
ncbi:MAG TPA: MlaD family protein [Candidatus Polarisedimenticolia bacterium]|nr:MlaD family protein [Candidatus Polarisedimenticolia bacterium]